MENKWRWKMQNADCKMENGKFCLLLIAYCLLLATYVRLTAKRYQGAKSRVSQIQSEPYQSSEDNR